MTFHELLKFLHYSSDGDLPEDFPLDPVALTAAGIVAARLAIYLESGIPAANVAKIAREIEGWLSRKAITIQPEIEH